MVEETAEKTVSPPPMETVEPVGDRLLICKDDDKGMTKGGIILPESTKIPVITGRIVDISLSVANNPDYHFQKLDKVLFDPRDAIPVEIDPNNKLFVVPVEDIVAVFHKH